MDHPPYAFDKKNTLMQLLEHIKNKITVQFTPRPHRNEAPQQWGFVAMATKARLETVAFGS
jgi:hypothetical protein